jgi:hypothetical protein
LKNRTGIKYYNFKSLVNVVVDRQVARRTVIIVIKKKKNKQGVLVVAGEPYIQLREHLNNINNNNNNQDQAQCSEYRIQIITGCVAGRTAKLRTIFSG